MEFFVHQNDRPFPHIQMLTTEIRLDNKGMKGSFVFKKKLSPLFSDYFFFESVCDFEIFSSSNVIEYLWKWSHKNRMQLSVASAAKIATIEYGRVAYV